MVFDLNKSIDQFLDRYPGMSTAPLLDSGASLKGVFSFTASSDDYEEISDEYRLDIFIPKDYPNAIPVIEEVGNKIARVPDNHLNGDGSLCLGTPLQLKMIVTQFPELIDFAAKCLVPYLYAISYKLKYGTDMILGELDHGVQGIIQEYSKLLGLRNQDQIKQALYLLGLKRRIANKKQCPCGCRRRLGACPIHRRLNKFRRIATTAWFRHHLSNDLRDL